MKSVERLVCLLIALLVTSIFGRVAEAQEYRVVRDTPRMHFRTYVRETSARTGAPVADVRNALLAGNPGDFILRGVDARGRVHWAHSGGANTWMNRRAGLVGTMVTLANFCPTCVRRDVWTIEGRRVSVPQTPAALARFQALVPGVVAVTPPTPAVTTPTPAVQVQASPPATPTVDAARLRTLEEENARLVRDNADLQRRLSQQPLPTEDYEHVRADRQMREQLRESWSSGDVLKLALILALTLMIVFLALGVFVGRILPRYETVEEQAERDKVDSGRKSGVDLEHEYGLQSIRPPPATQAVTQGAPAIPPPPPPRSDVMRELNKLEQADAQADASSATSGFRPIKQLVVSDRTGEVVDVEYVDPPKPPKTGAEHAGPDENTIDLDAVRKRRTS